MATKIITDYRLLSDYKLCQKARYILRCTTGTTQLQSLALTLVKLEIITNSFCNAINNAKSVNAELFLNIKEQKRNELLKLLNWLGLYVDFLADDDHDMIISSGFDMTGPPRAGLQKPKGFHVEVCGKGKVEASCRKVAGAYRYHYEFRASGKINWEAIIYGPNRIKITGLTTGIEYEFRVRPVAARRNGQYSQIVTQYIS